MEKKSIVLIGAEKISFSPQKILGEHGIEGVEVEVVDSDLKRFSFEKFKSSRYIAFFVGSVPHKTTATRNLRSLLGRPKTDLGQPIIRCHPEARNTPKICQSSFTRALRENLRIFNQKK